MSASFSSASGSCCQGLMSSFSAGWGLVVFIPKFQPLQSWSCLAWGSSGSLLSVAFAQSLVSICHSQCQSVDVFGTDILHSAVEARPALLFYTAERLPLSESSPVVSCSRAPLCSLGLLWIKSSLDSPFFSALFCHSGLSESSSGSHAWGPSSFSLFHPVRLPGSENLGVYSFQLLSASLEWARSQVALRPLLPVGRSALACLPRQWRLCLLVSTIKRVSGVFCPMVPSACLGS